MIAHLPRNRVSPITLNLVHMKAAVLETLFIYRLLTVWIILNLDKHLTKLIKVNISKKNTS